MATILLVVFSDIGQLNPSIAVAQELEQSGHDVVVYSLGDDVAEPCASAGLRARCLRGGSAAMVAPKPDARRSVEFARRLRNPTWFGRWIGAVLVDQVETQVAELRAAVHAIQPDLVVCNAMAYAAAIVGELEHIPWATLSTGLQSLPPPEGTRTAFRDIAPARDAVVSAFVVSLEFRESDVISPWLNVGLCIADLLPADFAPTTFHVGPAIAATGRVPVTGFRFDLLPDDRPIVYVAFGSLVSHPPQVYDMLVSSLSADEAFFVLAVKDLVGEPFVSALPAHALAVRWVPQIAMLRRAAVMVNHGGANSVLESIQAGVPSVVMPVTLEQAQIGQLVEAAGVGMVVDPDRLTVADCRELLLRLIAGDAPQRAAAARMSRQCEGGARRAAELLSRLATDRRPLAPPT